MLTQTAAVLRSAPADLTTATAITEALESLPWALRNRQVVHAT